MILEVPGALDVRPVFTSHGTSMFIDKTSGELRHGLLEAIQPNVHLKREDGSARLVLSPSGEACPIDFGPHRSALAQQVDAPADELRQSGDGTSFTIVQVNRNEFALHASGLFLSAEPDGRITLSREQCQTWELFHVRDDAQETTGTVVSYRIDGKMLHFFVNNRRDWIQHHQCRGDFFERDSLDCMRLHCPSGRTYVDVGANVGNHAIFAAKFCDLSDLVVFEPNPESIRLLEINLALNGCAHVDTRFLGLALGSANRMLSLSEPVRDNLGGTRLIEQGGGRIRCIRGDDVLRERPVGFIKIDVEGMEFDVLDGFRDTLRRWRPNILIEVWQAAYDRLLTWCRINHYELVKALPWDNYLLKPARAVS